MVSVGEAANYSIVERGDLERLNLLTLEAKDLHGIVVECGVYTGGSALILANAESPLYLFDSFEMMPESSTKDLDWNKDISWNSRTSVDDFRKLLQEFNIENASILVGWFQDILPIIRFGKEISLLHIDVDLYDSYMVCFKYLYPQVMNGGIVIIDDYYSYEGCRKAVENYFGENIPDLIRLGSYSVYFRKE